MLDLKAKLLAAGLVTAEQVQKIDDDKKRADERKSARMQSSGGGAAGQTKRDRKGRDVDEVRAVRDHKQEEAQRWRKRLDDVKAAGKSEQYQVVRGWVERHRIDDKTAMPSENAARFHFLRDDATIGHVTLEPELKQKLAAGEAGIVAFMGHNGIEHAVVPPDLARDIAHVKPEWLRSLVGVTDLEPSATETSADVEASVLATPDAAEPALEPLGEPAPQGDATAPRE